jgi:hypothetical protein
VDSFSETKDGDIAGLLRPEARELASLEAQAKIVASRYLIDGRGHLDGHGLV